MEWQWGSVNPPLSILQLFCSQSVFQRVLPPFHVKEENGGAATVETRLQLVSTRSAAIPEQVTPEDFVLSTGESDTDSLTDQSGESKQSSSNSVAEG